MSAGDINAAGAFLRARKSPSSLQVAIVALKLIRDNKDSAISPATIAQKALIEMGVEDGHE
jgi:hypothetical protein